MLTIKVNGREEKINIGCRTFISLSELLTLLSSIDSAVTLNGYQVRSLEFGRTIVNGGDALVLSTCIRHS